MTSTIECSVILNNKIRKLKEYTLCDMSRVLSYSVTIAEQKILYYKLQPIFLSKSCVYYIKIIISFKLPLSILKMYHVIMRMQAEA